MQAPSALQTFQDFLSSVGLSVDMLTPTEAIDSMIQFYTQIRADECAIDSDADMLLFQWGLYDWGTAEFFEYNITRQLIYSETVPPDPVIADDEESEEDIVAQLSLTLKYAPASELRMLTPGNRWCQNLTDVPAFTTFIADCEATKQVQQRVIVARELHIGNAA